MRNVVVLLVVILTATPSRADTAAAWAALRAGKAVALIRHADAPGIGDPPGYKLEDCSTQRNLSERGKAQAAAIGALFRANQIAVSRIISSPWCRCLETARLMDVGPVAVDSSFSNAFVLTDRRDELKAQGSAVISAWQSGNLLVVTHGANIAALSGLQVAPAETLVVEPGLAGDWPNSFAELVAARLGHRNCTRMAIGRKTHEACQSAFTVWFATTLFQSISVPRARLAR